MSDPGPLGGFGFDPNQLARMLSSTGPVNFELARMVATQSAAGDPEQGDLGPPTSNVDPLQRIRLEELVRVAELHVGQITGLSTSTTGRPLTVRAVTAPQWAEQTLEDYKPLLEGLATALAPNGERAEAPDLPPGLKALGPLFAELPKMLAPMLMGMQSGLLVGQLASHALGGYELPIPRPTRDELLFVSPALDALAADWSLPADDVGLWACANEVTRHAVLGVPHVRAALDDLLRKRVSLFRPATEDLAGRIESMTGSEGGQDLEALQQMLSDLELVLGAIESDEQRALRPRMSSLVAVVEGYVAHVLDQVAASLVASYGPLQEALRRRRVTERESDRFVSRLLGLETGDVALERGRRFVRGVLERAGDDGLNRLWSSEATLPTPNEVDAPGLWLARLESL